MGSRPPLLKPWIKWGIIFLCWTAFALFFTYQIYLSQYRFAGKIEWLKPLLTCLTWAYVWFAVTPLILYVAERMPFRRRRPVSSVIAHSLAAALVFCLNSVIYVPLHRLVVNPGPSPRPVLQVIQQVIATELHIGLVVYWIIFGITQGLDYYLRYRAGELRAANLETQLVQAQLNALRMQLHPHFLFNTLNSISVLMRKDLEAADRMLLQLGTLLRVMLTGNTTHEIQLRQELEILDRYLEIEKIRFQDRLTVKLQIDPAALEALVPQLLFQPLVENAIRHGIAEREAGGVIEICAERRNGTVHLQVRDNGPGLKTASGTFSEGVGLSNSRSRLEYLYGSAGVFEVSDAEDGGVVVTAALPFHTETTIEVEAMR
ncbi:MAG TPA: histidine kinase [Blastocatellia bacterium]|nr:histidine kinase [Blastocatellia bacterium]